MRNRHKSKINRGTKDQTAIAFRKALRKGRALCAICGVHHADVIVEGKAVFTGHTGVSAIA
jgi:hypothetical protein